MKRSCIVIITVMLWLALEGSLPPFGLAAPRAWLLAGEGQAAKLDLIRNVILETTVLPSGEFLPDEVAVDALRGNLFVVVGHGPYNTAVYNSKTLKRNAWLDFTADESPTMIAKVIRFIFPPTGSEFFARVWNPEANGGSGAFGVVTIDARTFKAIARRPTAPPLAEKLMLDAVGQRLYSMTSEKPAHIDIFALPGFTTTGTINLEPFVDPAAIGQSIQDFSEGKILFNEITPTPASEAGRYTLYVFDTVTGQITPKVATGLAGIAKLLPRSNRILFNERTLLTPNKPLLRPGKDLVYPGRIHVYDAIAGVRVATVAVSDVRIGEILGVNPTEDTCYYISQTATGETKLSVIDLRTYAVVKEVPLDYYADKMIFFEE